MEEIRDGEWEEGKRQRRFGDMPLFIDGKWVVTNVLRRSANLSLVERVKCLYGWYILERHGWAKLRSLVFPSRRVL